MVKRKRGKRKLWYKRRPAKRKILQNPQHTELNQLFYTPSEPGSYTSARKLYKAAKERNGDIKLTTVSDWLSKNEIQNLHRYVQQNFKRSKVYTKGLRDMMEIDLMDVSNIAEFNDDINYLLVLIDAFSRELWVHPQKTKSAKDTLKSLSTLLEKSGVPKRIRGDSGKEFINKYIENKIQKNNIKFINVTNEKSKAAFAERVIRTLKKKLYKYLHTKQQGRYIDVLGDLVQSYNNTYHSSIKMKPSEVNKSNEFKLWMRLYLPTLLKSVPQPKYAIGDKVRITRYRNKFYRGYYQQWTREYFTISKIIYSSPIRYQLIDLNGEPIAGSFYEKELQPVYNTDETRYNIEKVLDERGKGRQKQYLVKFQGWDDNFNQWVKANDVANL